MKNNNFKREELRDFIVRIEYKNGEEVNSASGVIIKTAQSAYILTVKHTFKKRMNEDLWRIEPVDFHLITVYAYDRKPIAISEVVFVDNNKLDIALLKIDLDNFIELNKIKTLELYMGDFNFCAIAGYPQSRENNQSVIIQASNPDEIEEDETSIQLQAESQIVSYGKDEMETLQGLSGGGVFKRGESGKIYLIGIQYAYSDYTVFLKILDIRAIIDEIEKKIDEELMLGKYPFFERLGIDASKLNFESLENKFSLNKDIQKVKRSKNEYKFLLEDNRRNRNLEKSYLALKKQMKQLADIYIYHGKVFFDREDRVRAFNAFSRAIELSPEYKIYFLKDEFIDHPLSDKQKKERDSEEENTKISSESDIVEIILEDNIKSNIKNNEKDSLEINIEKFISFLSSNFKKNKQRIMNLLMKLSRVKEENGKPIEAEKILLNLRDNFDNGNRHDEINQRLLLIYQTLLDSNNNSISIYELRVKLEKLLIFFQNREDIHLSITNMITHVKIDKYYDHDCFIQHLEKQRQEIDALKMENYQFRVNNQNYYNLSIIEEPEKSNIPFLSFGLLISLGVTIMVLEYFNCPALEWIESLNMDFFRSLFNF